MKIKAVIFDLDGTITQPFFDFDKIKVQMGLEVSGGPIWEAMGKMCAEDRAAAEKILLEHERLGVESSRLNPTAEQTLVRLRDLGLPIGILTRNTKDNVFAVAAKHGLDFDLVVGREDGPVKPDPFGVEHICSQFGVDPSETLVVGDYLFDLVSARSANAVSVLLTSHKKHVEYIEFADFIIERLEQVFEIIDTYAA